MGSYEAIVSFTVYKSEIHMKLLAKSLCSYFAGFVRFSFGTFSFMARIAYVEIRFLEARYAVRTCVYVLHYCISRV